MEIVVDDKRLLWQIDGMKNEMNDLGCAFCYPREQGKHGEVKREWSQEWLQFIPVCRKHALCDGMDQPTPIDDGRVYGTP